MLGNLIRAGVIAETVVDSINALAIALVALRHAVAVAAAHHVHLALLPVVLEMPATLAAVTWVEVVVQVV